MSLSIKFVSHSETGLVRKMNQDSCYASPNLLIVADGMGGAAAGDLASCVAVNGISKVDQRHSGEEMLEVLAGALAKINDDIADLIDADPELVGMGSTLTGVMFSGTQLAVTNIGDSRTYLLRDGELSRLTHDHSFVQSLVDEHKITFAEAEKHPHRSLLLKVLNGQSQHEADYQLRDAQCGDRLLICSDGLCGFVSDDKLAQILTETDLGEVSDKLIEAAYAGSSSDNITFIVADLVDQDSELDSAAPVMLGAAVNADVAKLAKRTGGNRAGFISKFRPKANKPAAIVAAEPADEAAEAEDSADLADEPDGAADSLASEDLAEKRRYAPTGSRRRFVFPIVSSMVALAVLACAGYFGYSWSQRQFYIGANQGKVAIYRGVPEKIFGLSLSSLVADQRVNVADLPVHYREKIADNIKVPSLEKANETVAQLEQLADYCIAKRQRQQSSTVPTNATTLPSGSISSTGSNNLTPTPGVSAVASSPNSSSSLPTISVDPLTPSGTTAAANVNPLVGQDPEC